MYAQKRSCDTHTGQYQSLDQQVVVVPIQSHDKVCLFNGMGCAF